MESTAAKMRGKVGTEVSLTLLPFGKELQEKKTVSLIREKISLSPVSLNLDTHTGSIPIGYIRLNQFSANAAQEISNAITNLEKQGA
ncbi:MAG: hypothetical protein RLZZ148_1514, partial [Cyanobacteriota bacterium]